MVAQPIPDEPEDNATPPISMVPDPLILLTRDQKLAATLLSAEQARYFVDLYYAQQNDRIRANAQARTLDDNGEPNAIASWYADQSKKLEDQIRLALGRYAAHQVPGQWAMAITGIGPVIAAGLLCHIDIEKAPTAGHIWRFAGVDPTLHWGKGEKRPWNARLKRLTWIIGESFVKVSNNPNDVYGKVWRQRKDLEIERNERGDFAEQAAAALAAKRYRDDTGAKQAYDSGKLPPAHIHARARRYAVKLFLAHYHHVAYEDHFGKSPPKPYIIEHGGHTHFIAPPNWPPA